MVELGVNIDHVATLRQARRTYEPDPVWAAVEAHLGGADGITVHLREDRRHIQDEDVRRLRELVHIKLNLEMAPTPEMLAIACTLKPEMAMLVPEGRHEITTEGGIDVVGEEMKLKAAVARLNDAGIVTSVFIDAEVAQIDAAARIGAKVCEIHTGPYAHAFQCRARAQLFQRTAGCGSARRPRAAHRARDCFAFGVRRIARSGAANEGAVAGGGRMRNCERVMTTNATGGRHVTMRLCTVGTRTPSVCETQP